MDLSVLNDRTSIWISLSGGTDTAALFYLVAKYIYDNNLDVKVTPWCCVDVTRPGNDKIATSIANAVKARIPIDIEDPIFRYFEKEPGGDKPSLTRPFYEEMRSSGLYDCYIDALSASPTIKDMKSYPGFLEAFERVWPENRLPGQNLPTTYWDNDFLTFKPYINKDKKFIAEIYEKEDLMDDVFPLTQSCVGRGITPCMNCFWCYEKHWAFGLYDLV